MLDVSNCRLRGRAMHEIAIPCTYWGSTGLLCNSGKSPWTKTEMTEVFINRIFLTSLKRKNLIRCPESENVSCTLDKIEHCLKFKREIYLTLVYIYICVEIPALWICKQEWFIKDGECLARVICSSEFSPPPPPPPSPVRVSNGAQSSESRDQKTRGQRLSNINYPEC